MSAFAAVALAFEAHHAVAPREARNVDRLRHRQRHNAARPRRDCTDPDIDVIGRCDRGIDHNAVAAGASRPEGGDDEHLVREVYLRQLRQRRMSRPNYRPRLGPSCRIAYDQPLRLNEAAVGRKRIGLSSKPNHWDRCGRWIRCERLNATEYARSKCEEQKG